ncbi:MAG: lysoplasmalogenase [Paraglaciecola sp.]|uniref:lysoplasmalogenase n=1 Tax=Paraglaciecola sp. TaxID=1920173 RepID=UPI0032983958
MSKNMRLAFMSFSLAYLVSVNFVENFLWLLKVIPILLLAIAVSRTAPSQSRSVLLFALIFSGCGDLLLAVDEFIYGVAAFLVAQLSYGFLFSRTWNGITNRWPLSVVMVVYMVFMIWLLMPQLGELLLPVIVYLLAIATMGLLAIQSKLPMQWAVLGAVVFIISDSFIAVNKFIFAVPFETFWIMSTYYAAQFMLVVGFLAHQKSLMPSQSVE